MNLGERKNHFARLMGWVVLVSLVEVLGQAVAGAALAKQSGAPTKPIDHRPVVLRLCEIADVPGGARCGAYEVFENRVTKRGRKIALNIVMLPALSARRQPDALFILAGGPGQAATDNAGFYARVFARVREERDIVLVDQRGTGKSNPLGCDLYGDSLQGPLGDLLPPNAINKCRAEWEKRADLRYYTTPIAMDDLDEVRAVLGYEQIDLFGTSYGTRAAQVYIRRYPNRVRSVILKGITPMAQILPYAIARDAQRALDKVFEECEKDEACSKNFPNFRGEFAAVLKRFEKGPVSVQVVNPNTGQKDKVELSRGAIATTIRSLMQSTGTIAQLPMIIHQSFANDYSSLVRAVSSLRLGFSKSVSVGMFLSVINTEDLPATDAKTVERESSGTFMGDHYYQQVAAAARVLPKGEVLRGYHRPVRSTVPALLISGYLDPATPPEGGDDVARHLPNSRHIVIRYGSHSYTGLSPCVDQIMSDFIKSGSVKRLDVSCSDQIHQTPFQVSSRANP